MLPPFKGPHVVVQLLCRLHQSDDLGEEGECIYKLLYINLSGQTDGWCHGI